MKVALTVAVAWLAVTGAAATAAGTPSPAAAAADPPVATDIGVTPHEIRIAVVADVDSPLAPGLFQGAVDAVRGFARYVNANRGLAGRRLVVDFIDSRLSADEARNAVITACEHDFALVGTSALFLNNVDDMVSCVDAFGRATGLPDLPGVPTELAHACSPVSFPVSPPAIACSTRDESPQRYRGNIGSIRYYQREFGQDLHGVTVNTGDLASAHNSIQVGYELAEQAGVKVDAEFNVSARSPQSAYTPIVHAIKDSRANIVLDQLTFGSNISLRKEAKLQGVTGVKVWSCPVSCYERAFLEQGGVDVDGHFVPIPFLPFDETKSNAMLASFVKYSGRDKVTGLGALAWAAGVLLRDSVNSIVEQHGVNGLTRARLMTTLADTHDFDAGGMFGPIDIGARRATPCGVMMQVRNGKFVRLTPKKPGTLRCDAKNFSTIELDLLKGQSG